MRITCTCGKHLNVKDEWVGKLVKCPGCGNKIRVAEDKPEAPPARKQKETPQRKKVKRKPSSRRSALPWILGGGGAVVVAAVAIALVFVFTRSRSRPDSGPRNFVFASSPNRTESGPPVVNAQNPQQKMASAANSAYSPAIMTPAAQVLPNLEGETWKSADLLNYLRGQGIKVFAFGKPHSYENDTKMKKHLIEELILVGDESAAARAPNKTHPIYEAFDELKKGIGFISLTHFHSADLARQQPPADDEGNLVWGRFIMRAFNGLPKGGDFESGNLQSRILIQQIRKALGLTVVPVALPTETARPGVSSPPSALPASRMNWVEMAHEKGKYSIVFPGKPMDLDPMIEGAPVTRTVTLPGGEEFQASFTFRNRPNPLQDKELMPKLFDAFFQGAGQVLKADFSKRTSLTLGDYPGQECLTVIPSKQQQIRCRLYFTENRSYDLSVKWASALHPADWPDAKKFLDSFKLIK